MINLETPDVHQKHVPLPVSWYSVVFVYSVVPSSRQLYTGATPNNQLSSWVSSCDDYSGSAKPRTELNRTSGIFILNILPLSWTKNFIPFRNGSHFTMERSAQERSLPSLCSPLCQSACNTLQHALETGSASLCRRTQTGVWGKENPHEMWNTKRDKDDYMNDWNGSLRRSGQRLSNVPIIVSTAVTAVSQRLIPVTG